MPKLFFAVIPPAELQSQLQETFIPHIQKFSNEWRISNPEQWHITIHFIGIVSKKAEEKIREGFEHISLPRLGRVKLGGFPPLETFRKNILFVRVEDENQTLSKTYESLRSIVPVHQAHPNAFHLTLARIKKKKKLDHFEGILSSPPFTSTFLVRELILFRSEQVEGKTIHIPLGKRSFPL